MGITKEIKEALFRRYFSFLNEKQQDAVLAPDGPLLVIAGAGSGKTTVLVNRISYLIRYGKGASSDKEVPMSKEEADMLTYIATTKDPFPKSAILISPSFSSVSAGSERRSAAFSLICSSFSLISIPFLYRMFDMLVSFYTIILAQLRVF